MHRAHRRSPLALLCLAAAVASAAPAAAVPGEVNFQGLLLDANGDPVTGNADLVLRLFDAETGGTLLWTETQNGIEVLSGVYDVSLGASTPLTPSILAGGVLYLEVEVDGDLLTPRQRLLAVPFALRAGTAETSEDVGGLSSAYVTELIEHVNLDGGGPSNLDPAEGLGDPDGDGIANFVDPDNDNDGTSDIDEVALGTDLNLVTPVVAGFSPPTADGFLVTTIDVSGTGFEPGLSVSFGSQTPTPQNLTSTSFQVDVGPQAEGTATVTVSNPNGQTTGASYPFFLVPPVISGFDPATADGFVVTTVEVQGQDFIPPLSVDFGTQSPTPQNVTPTSFEVDVGPQPEGTATVTVTNANGVATSASFDFFLVPPQIGVLVPDRAAAGATTTVQVQGTDFIAPLSVVFGSETPTPQNVTPTSFELDVGPQAPGLVSVEVTNANGKVDTASFEFFNENERRIFVSDVSVTGSALGGIAGADQRCADAASAAGLGGNFLAWLGDATTDPATRIASSPPVGPYVLVDDTIVATDYADLADGSIAAPIDLTAAGVGVPARNVWTGVLVDGTAAPGAASNCNGWFTPGTGVVGRTDRTDAGWTDNGTSACGVVARLFCVEVTP